MKIVKKIIIFFKFIFSAKSKIDDMFFLIMYREEILDNFDDGEIMDCIDQKDLEKFEKMGTTLEPNIPVFDFVSLYYPIHFHTATNPTVISNK